MNCLQGWGIDVITLELKKAKHPYWYEGAEANVGAGPRAINDTFQLSVLRDPATEQLYMPQQHARRILGFAYNAKLTLSAIA